ncbi:MAG: peptidylprolyl isomerase [Myxococcota bacterium]
MPPLSSTRHYPLSKLYKEPLLHFLVGGLALFAVYGIVGGGGSEVGEDVIVVDRDALLTFVQYRTKAFEPSVAAARLDALSEPELERLIADYVREEVLYREALALGLDRDDYIIRRRMVQKLEFITEGFAEATSPIDDADLLRYFEANKADYYVDPHVTFTHVFFSTEARTREEARRLADEKLGELNANHVHFSDAPKHGDRFLYHVNYVERTPEFVASHFGPEMTGALFKQHPDETTWLGPFDSSYGVHLVMLTANRAGRDAVIEEVKERVVEDAKMALTRERLTDAIDDIVDAYDVRVVYGSSAVEDAPAERESSP